jgi:DNA-binding NtrC family response regulator
MQPTVLIIESEVESRQTLAQVLEQHLLFNTLSLANPAEAVSYLYQKHESMPEVILMDVASNTLLSLQIIQQIRERFPSLPVIALTNYGDMQQADQSLQAGAMDFLARPVSRKRLHISLRNAMRNHRMAEELAHLQRQKVSGFHRHAVPAKTLLQQALPEQVDQSRYLICGERGAGKEIAAYSMHLRSVGADYPFHSINALALSDAELEILETGPKEALDKLLALSSLQKGTLFINHIDRLSLVAQERLYRLPADICVIMGSAIARDDIAESNYIARDIAALPKALVIQLLPLREMMQDIELYANYYLRSYAIQQNPSVVGMSVASTELLKSYHWPGNLRELDRVIFRAVMLAESSLLEPESLIPFLPPDMNAEVDAQHQQQLMIRSQRMALTDRQGEIRRLRDLEADMIQFAISFYEGRISEVARKLGIGRSTLYRKLHDLDIHVA